MDWVARLEEEGGIEGVRDTLQTVSDFDADDYLDSDDGNAAVAAARVIASLAGAARSQVPKNVKTRIVGFKFSAADAALAACALDRVLAENSELVGLWGEDSTWHEETMQLRAQLQSIGGAATASRKPKQKRTSESHYETALRTFAAAVTENAKKPLSGNALALHNDAAELVTRLQAASNKRTAIKKPSAKKTKAKSH